MVKNPDSLEGGEMARENCSVCGGVLRTRTDGGCTKCENRHWYRRAWRAMRRNWILIAALAAIVLLAGLGFYSLNQRIGSLETQVAEQASAITELERQNAEQELEIQTLKNSVADLEQAVAENTAAREELQRLLEELQETCQQVTLPEQKTITVKQGDTVWDLLTQELGRYPTWEEIQKVVDANNLGNFMDGQGRWIVLIYPGQVLDLSPALGP